METITPSLAHVIKVSYAYRIQEENITPLFINIFWKEFPQSKCKDSKIFVIRPRCWVKISVLRLILPLFVPFLASKRSRYLFIMGKTIRDEVASAPVPSPERGRVFLWIFAACICGAAAYCIARTGREQHDGMPRVFGAGWLLSLCREKRKRLSASRRQPSYPGRKPSRRADQSELTCS